MMLEASTYNLPIIKVIKRLRGKIVTPLAETLFYYNDVLTSTNTIRIWEISGCGVNKQLSTAGW